MIRLQASYLLRSNGLCYLETCRIPYTWVQKNSRIKEEYIKTRKALKIFKNIKNQKNFYIFPQNFYIFLENN